MTPLQEYQYGEAYTKFRFRIGKTPLNLATLGDAPHPGEISEEVDTRIQVSDDRRKYRNGVQERWELHERYSKENKALEAKLEKLKLRLNEQGFSMNSSQEPWEDLSDEDSDIGSSQGSSSKKLKNDDLNGSNDLKSWKKYDQMFWQYYCLNDLKESARVATLMLGKYPYVIESWWNNYMVNINGDPEDNLIFRKKIREMTKKDTKFYFNIEINAFIDEERFKEAIDACDKGLSFFPGESYYFHLKAYCLSKIGKELEAIEAWKTSINLKPLRPYVIWCNIGEFIDRRV